MIIFYIIAVYMLIGTVAGRTLWRSPLGDPAMAAAIAERKEKLRTMSHGGSCYRNPASSYYNTSRDCDCNRSTEWRELRSAADPNFNRSWLDSSPYPLVFGWPLLGYHKFVTGGRTKPAKIEYNPEVAAQVERMLEERAGIPPREDAA